MVLSGSIDVMPATIDGPPTFEEYALPGYAYPGEPRKLVSYQIPEPLNRRLNGAARWAGDTGKLPGTATKADLVRVSLHTFVSELEDRYLDGRQFERPTKISRGRGRLVTSTMAKLTVHLPISLTDRIAGAADFVEETALIADVTSINRLVAYAIGQHLEHLELSYRNGRPFKDPRRLSPGRPSLKR